MSRINNEIPLEDYSVLMSVYHREKREYLTESIKSMVEQSHPPYQFVLVKDGPLTPELDEVIDDFNKQYPDLFSIVSLAENRGIGDAANAGLSECKCELIVKMDADDISRKDRCELQIREFQLDGELDIIGSQLVEFDGDISNITAVREVPTAHDDIVKFAKRRSPFNNQTVVYKKSTVLSAGGYSGLKRCEDYDLFIRLLHNGAKSKNIDEGLVYFRLNSDAYARRGTLKNTSAVIKSRYDAMKIGFSSPLDFIIAVLGQLFIAILPNRLKNWLYIKFLRG
ncbi:MAG: glycosyltransferase [Clostridiales bacterium]|nr:glycosyltransferase [Clostridiales bacterium]